jgi:hypothetical protein
VTSRLLGLGAFQWIALVAALLTMLVLVEAWIGHYRSGFPLRVQYAPFASGGLLIVAALATGIAPGAAWAQAALRVTGWTAVVTGLIGLGYHHYYGIARKAGSYKWLLHYLMYGAPQLAPLALSTVGALAVLAAQGAAGRTAVLGIGLRSALFGTVAIALAGAIAQAGILHYRGAFNNPVMYAPVTVPVLAAVTSGWMSAAPATAPHTLGRALFALTFLIGFLGLGMHLRGFDRQMGGLHIFLFNLLQGPPPLAPAIFAGLAAIGLIATEML